MSGTVLTICPIRTRATPINIGYFVTTSGRVFCLGHRFTPINIGYFLNVSGYYL